MAMSLGQTAGHELEWRQPEMMRRFFELADGGQQVASLRFESGFGSLATGNCGQGSWTFKRSGFLSPKVSVREAATGNESAVFTPGWSGSGWVAFRAGVRYQLRSTNFWRTEWAFEAEDGSVLVTLEGRPHLFKQGGVVTVAELAASVAETPVLLLLMWYVRVLMHEDAAAGAAVAGA
jgi:hypothetical protein